MNTISLTGDYLQLFKTISSVLGLSFAAICEKYAGIPLSIRQFRSGGIENTIVYVEPDNPGITFAFCIGEDGICRTSFLLPEDIGYLNDMVDCLNENYAYNYIYNSWALPGCSLSIRILESAPFIVFYKMPGDEAER